MIDLLEKVRAGTLKRHHADAVAKITAYKKISTVLKKRDRLNCSWQKKLMAHIRSYKYKTEIQKEEEDNVTAFCTARHLYVKKMHSCHISQDTTEF